MNFHVKTLAKYIYNGGSAIEYKTYLISLSINEIEHVVPQSGKLQPIAAESQLGKAIILGAKEVPLVFHEINGINYIVNVFETEESANYSTELVNSLDEHMWTRELELGENHIVVEGGVLQTTNVVVDRYSRNRTNTVLTTFTVGEILEFHLDSDSQRRLMHKVFTDEARKIFGGQNRG